MASHKDDAAQILDAHGRSIDALHQKLAAIPGADQAALKEKVQTYKAAHQQFHDDALECMH